MSKLLDDVRNVMRVRHLDFRRGLGRVEMPFALGRKYPNAAKEFAWQYVFPSKKH